MLRPCLMQCVLLQASAADARDPEGGIDVEMCGISSSDGGGSADNKGGRKGRGRRDVKGPCGSGWARKVRCRSALMRWGWPAARASPCL